VALGHFREIKACLLESYGSASKNAEEEITVSILLY
jgi:hypothetical protein